MILLSNRQYPMLQAFMDGGGADFFMPLEEAQRYDQRPFRSMLVRGWVGYRPGRGFHLTREGRDAWHDYHATEIFRKNPRLPLTAYFDPTAYRMAPKAVHVLKKRHAVA